MTTSRDTTNRGNYKSLKTTYATSRGPGTWCDLATSPVVTPWAPFPFHSHSIDRLQIMRLQCARHDRSPWACAACPLLSQRATWPVPAGVPATVYEKQKPEGPCGRWREAACRNPGQQWTQPHHSAVLPQREKKARGSERGVLWPGRWRMHWAYSRKMLLEWCTRRVSFRRGPHSKWLFCTRQGLGRFTNSS